MTWYSVKLFKIESNHEKVRTDTVEGACSALPDLHTSFTMWSEGLQFGTRLVYTTTIKELTWLGDTYLFKTENSTYVVQVLKVNSVD